MAGNNTSEIRVAGSGRILVAAAGAAVPADFGTDWDPAVWKDLGSTSTDGVTFSKKDKLDPVDTWQAVSPVRFIYSDRELTLKFSLMQFNEDTFPFFMGGGTVAQVDPTKYPGVYGYSLVGVFMVLQAPDVALSMLVVSTVAYPLIVLVTIARLRRRRER